MKKYQKELLPLVLLALTACTTTETGSSSRTYQTPPISDSGSSVSSGDTPEPIVKTFALTTQAAEGSTIAVQTTAQDSKYEAGTLIEFSVTVNDANKELKSVLVNDKLIAPTDGNNYEF